MAVFAKVVDTASFAEAARHFGMSPAMVSKHVSTLEERLGVRLLNRTTRRVGATEVGQDITSAACASSPNWKTPIAPPATCKRRRADCCA
jgi:DNA-binding transcriptional LysR family regulator